MLNDPILIWAVLATIAALALLILHFANPYPLIQIPDRGHRIYALPDPHATAVMTEILAMTGLQPFGIFVAGGIYQTMMRDGNTVLAYGDGLRNAISLPVSNPTVAAMEARDELARKGVMGTIFIPPGKHMGTIVVLKLPQEFGWDIAYRLPGHRMPKPRWTKKF